MLSLRSLFSRVVSIMALILVVTIILIITGNAEFKLNITGHSIFQQEKQSNEFYISRTIADELNKQFISTDKEFAGCIDASQIANKQDSSIDVTYNIDKLSQIKVFEEGYSELDYCDEGTVHSHPKGTCYFSISDIMSFKDRITKGEYFSVLVCGKDKFYYINKNNFVERKLKIN